MSASAGSSPKSADSQKQKAGRPTLRDAQKAFTRARFRDAAGDLFGRNGYHATTIDHIVTAAGSSRQTFYLHFADKEAVLSELVDDYTPRADEQLASLPGPLPSLQEIVLWVENWTRFVIRERGLVAALMEVGSFAPVRPTPIRTTMDRAIEAIGNNIPAFATARRNDTSGLEAHAYAELVMASLTTAARIALQNDSEEYARTMIQIAAEGAHRFIHDPRFAPRRREPKDQ
jgi:AcrR family transcriptional regulator